MSKETAIQKRDVVLLIYQLILKGNDRTLILNELEKQNIDTGPEDYEAALDLIAKEGFVDLFTVRGFCLTAKKELFKCMRGAGDYPGALRALESYEKTARELIKPNRPKPAKATTVTAEIDEILKDD